MEVKQSWLGDNTVVISIEQFVASGIVNCIYFNPQIEQFWIIDYRIYDPDTDKKTKIDHVEEMILNVVNQNKLRLKKVLMDSWYAAKRLMGLVDNMGKVYYCPFKINRARR